MAGDVVDMPGSRETDRLRLALRKAEERIEELKYELAEARGEHALAQTGAVNQVWFVPLTPTQARMLELLCDASPRIVSQQVFIDRLYESGREPQAHNLSVQLSRLRALIALIGLEILTERGRGWRMSPAGVARWRRWCRSRAAGEPPSSDFRIDPARAKGVTGHPARQQRFFDDVTAASRLIDRGVPAGEIAERIGRPVAFVAAIGRDGGAEASCPAPTGRSRDEVVEEAVRRTLAETPVTLPDTARRAAGHAVDLMSEEVMAMIADGET